MATRILGSRAAGLAQLRHFLPLAGNHYAENRHFDDPDARGRSVSGLSPWLRHGLISEAEVVGAVCDLHGLDGAWKFVQEVCWRSYWKGWLQQRPSIWADYRAERDRALMRMAQDRDLATRYQAAVSGTTGIDVFDAWMAQLCRTGYLHNHARMNAASIWVFTLRLPWALGADHFMRHLIDGDPASNTLSWRWVAGLQTAGKVYAARADTIAHCSRGRFAPHGQLQDQVEALRGPGVPAAQALPQLPQPDRAPPSALLLTDDQLLPESWADPNTNWRLVIAVDGSVGRSPGHLGAAVARFASEAIDDGLARAISHTGASGIKRGWSGVASALDDFGIDQVVTAEPLAGPNADAMAYFVPAWRAQGVRWSAVRRDWDACLWPHARRGFFHMRKHIPDALERLAVAA